MRARAFAAAAVIVTLAAPATASAHVEMSSSTVGDGLLFTVSSPNENEQQDLTDLQLTIPDGMTVAEVADPPGFTSELVKDQSGRVVGIRWTGGSVPPEHLALFQFSGAIDGGATLQLSALQTFADGSTKTWTPEVSAPSDGETADTLARVLAGGALIIALGAAALAALGNRRRVPA